MAPRRCNAHVDVAAGGLLTCAWWWTLVWRYASDQALSSDQAAPWLQRVSRTRPQQNPPRASEGARRPGSSESSQSNSTQDEGRSSRSHEANQKLALVQAALRGELHALRGGEGGACMQRRKVFVARVRKNYNMGDELNLDLMAALLGVQPRCGGDEQNCSSASLVQFTQNNSEGGKLLMIGSTLRCARLGDLVFGAGIKPPVTEDMLQVLRSNGVSVFGVRGPKTCEIIRGTANFYRPSCPFYGDPAIYAHLLVPSWSDLRWEPLSAAWQGAPRLLCAVPHAFDSRLSLHALRLRERQATAHDLWRQKCANATRGQCGRRPAQLRVISTRQRDPLVAARRMLPCDVVVSSALHGVVMADALRIPSLWLTAFGTLARTDSNGLRTDARTASLLAEAARSVRGSKMHQQETAVPTHAHPFKFLDYFAGVGKEAQSVSTLDEALALLEDGQDLAPRFTLAELHAMALRFVRAFPMRRVATCKHGRSGGLVH